MLPPNSSIIRNRESAYIVLLSANKNEILNNFIPENKVRILRIGIYFKGYASTKRPSTSVTEKYIAILFHM